MSTAVNHPVTAAAPVEVTSRCAGCGACLLTCPQRAIRPAGGALLVRPELCDGCGECIEVCPVDAIAEVPYAQGPASEVPDVRVPAAEVPYAQGPAAEVPYAHVPADDVPYCDGPSADSADAAAPAVSAAPADSAPGGPR